MRFQGKVYGNEGLPGDAESHFARYSSTGLFSPKTLPLPLQTSDLGAFLAETLPNRRTQDICERTFPQIARGVGGAGPECAHYCPKRARKADHGAPMRALPIIMRSEEGSRGENARTLA